MPIRSVLISILALAGVAIIPTAARAGGGDDITLTSLVFEDVGFQLLVSGELADLAADKPVEVRVRASGKGGGICLDEQGTEVGTFFGATFQIRGEVTIDPDDVVNGTAEFSVLTDLPGQDGMIPGPILGCPNPKWIEVFTELGFNGPTVSIRQPGEGVVTIECETTATSDDGVIPEDQLICEQKKP